MQVTPLPIGTCRFALLILLNWTGNPDLRTGEFRGSGDPDTKPKVSPCQIGSIIGSIMATFSAGMRLGPYEVIGAIGAGGMGEVYRAPDSRIGRDVAVKILPSQYSKAAHRLGRFEQEARTAGLLKPPNILAVHDVGTQDGCPYLVTELLEGETLRQRVLAGPLSPRKTVEYA